MSHDPRSRPPDPGPLTELARLTAIAELEGLKARFSRYVETSSWPELGRLFTPNGQARFYDPNGSLICFADSPNIGTVIGRGIGAGRPIHHVFSPELTILSPTRAEGLWAMEDRVIYPGVDAPFRRMHGFGHYHETYERPDGRWLIRSLELTRLRVEYT